MNSTQPRFNHQALGVKTAVVVDEALNQNNILWLKPSGQPIDGPTFNVGEDWRAVGLDAGVLALRMDFDRLHAQTQRHVEMISAGLIGAKHSPSDARFCTFRRQQSIACGRGDRVGCGSNPKQHGGKAPRCNQSRAFPRVAGERNTLRCVHHQQGLRIDKPWSVSRLASPRNRFPRACSPRP